jgi:hypothetical protein
MRELGPVEPSMVVDTSDVSGVGPLREDIQIIDRHAFAPLVASAIGEAVGGIGAIEVTRVLDSDELHVQGVVGPATGPKRAFAFVAAGFPRDADLPPGLKQQEKLWS